ncbi:GNAT family N-acetyltransferase [Winogradskya humida]|uniref:N-acetyltransferase domain-containing protein n=1 Tax=Winogradskya humida TaxID=113566 RepID=A0ABQ4A115_9ACTN|nr:GNAT family N-acetyltransferase [Actinoplanes humidus]GIE24536.1 hypothetical protein Ahu01nite_076380 [Actinoplanes humidus]
MTKLGIRDEWSIAGDPGEVHDLLCAADLFIAARYGTPVPRRRIQSTERLVASRSVRLLRERGTAIAMFTLTWEPSFETATDIFPPTAKPIYMQRLAVSPDLDGGDTLVGLRCVRQAMETARELGATAIRAETNPDLTNTVRLIEQFGFTAYGPVLDDGGVRRIRLQNILHEPERDRTA